MSVIPRDVPRDTEPGTGARGHPGARPPRDAFVVQRLRQAIVHLRQEPLIAELGAPTYTRQFFSAARYENIAARSLGHSVPFMNGHEQRAGAGRRSSRLIRRSFSIRER